MAANLGSMKLLKQFWSDQLTDWRVFIHRGFNWNHWEMFGPFPIQSRADAVFEEERHKGISNPPRRIRHGVYENTGQTNTVLLYHGLDVVSEYVLVIGQGISDEGKETTP